MKFRFIPFLLLLLACAHPAVARPPVFDILPLRLDGPGPRAIDRFKSPDSRCGILRDGGDGTRIFDTFESAILTLNFVGEKRRILPLLMTDKPGEGQVMKVKLRTACVSAIRREGNEYFISLATRLSPPGLSATLRVDVEGRLLNPEDNQGIFYVVGEYSRESRAIDRFALLARRLQRFTCFPGESDASCEYQFQNYAERLFADEIRHQTALPDAGRKMDQAELDKAVCAAISDRQTLALHRLIIANESATISPFQLWDAVLADSGLSFGPHQWDIGINPDGQRIFRSLAKLAGLPAPDRYFRSVWRFSTADFQSYVLWRGRLTAAMQSPAGRKLITDEYVRWLKGPALDKARAALPFLDGAKREHQMMLLYYSDVDNQYGDEGLKWELARLIEELSQDGADIQHIKTRLNGRMMQTPFAVSYPDKAAARLERTWGILSGL